ncbi:putative laccase [Oryza sativa Japonica Group]|uniref:Laccase-6 n=1 Tax=Oryza sativa subsp. japonica TaxID=39947 RepID=LAC6_ORYSJ|nr:laccase-6 [Oryza sativa Japonica Group]Q5N7A3.1 RecName: Full=Laccase-6; AltName: Full=Benzenediol:oxygen oxidoreductase 6; AltName: Full=Diphenol oxidase 6; AltName: Full=Urishiol oxidase 6; Flags: Precursor [Oryza sativa Japonica Group]KAB8084314.1 hypothetical protein EE612_006847 [Oryza sativa]KAF2953331.1 hypothetical protein DAI22_01g401200 [Oryza sativa Japonica Group]BAD81778.1 putative laccase [Oryza sativa Japonica Group]BAD82646.1 putative laccase [Oryza sativa Japonica Group]BA
MSCSWMIPVFAILAFVASAAQADVVEHTFNVATLSLPRICQPGNTSVTAVNGRVPGPQVEAREGDTVVIHVINDSPYNVTVHWHGVFQRGTPWADGPAMVTQCPIRPGHRYTYRFAVAGQEGTLWWHAHSSYMRATVYGALVIRPRRAGGYPFPTPYEEKTVLLGEWWNGDPVALESQSFSTGIPAPNADAYTINGMPGDSYLCPETTNRIAKFEVRRDKTYLLRIINAALNTAFFFKVAGHTFTVVAADASYTEPYATDVIVIAPGQTVDALMAADASPGCYHMAISSYQSAIPFPPRPAGFNGNTSTAIVEYVDATATTDAGSPVLPVMPKPNDTYTANQFYTSLTALIRPGRRTVPLTVDTRMLVTVGLGFSSCQPEQTQCNRSAPVVLANMNNVSFALPNTVSMLEALYRNTADGVYTRDFPDQPPVAFDYTSRGLLGNSPLASTGSPSTKVKTLRYNATVEMVLQNTALVGLESHPMHLHGFNFFVVAQGFGNNDGEAAGAGEFNLVNPQERNTVAVPTGGWAVIRFVADNPGMWAMHCHIDSHFAIGLAMVFEVESGPTPGTTLPPPPPDLPQC